MSEVRTSESFAYDVFISYSSRDRSWVREVLLPRLDQAGLRIFIDFREVASGDETRFEVYERGIRQSRKVLLVLTPDYFTSQWTEQEARLALALAEESAQGEPPRVIPILRSRTEMPWQLARLRPLDFTRESSSLPWQDLLRTLRGEPLHDRPKEPSTGKMPLPDFMRQMTRPMEGIPWEETELFARLRREGERDFERDAQDFADLFWSAFLESDDLRFSLELGNAPDRATTFIVGHESDGGHRRDLLAFVPAAMEPVALRFNVPRYLLPFSRRMQLVSRFARDGEGLRKKFHFLWEPGGEELLQSFVRQAQPAIVLMQQPPVVQQAAAPASAELVSTGALGSHSSVGVVASDGTDTGVTVACHALACGTTAGHVGQQVTVAGVTGTVKSIDCVSDSAFVTFGSGGCPVSGGVAALSCATTAPAYGQRADFAGIGSGCVKSTCIIATPPTLCYPHPGVQRHLLTQPDSVGGDSGCALISNGEVLGFCFGISGTSSPVQFSLWIWADSVFQAHGLT